MPFALNLIEFWPEPLAPIKMCNAVRILRALWLNSGGIGILRGPALAALSGLCVMLRQTRKEKHMDVASIGIIGAGQMGNGIAHVMALAGYDVVLNDISEDSLNAALARIEKNMERQVSREAISEADKQTALNRISASLHLPTMVNYSSNADDQRI